ncbi:ROK family transcriptional regulator [Fictibacillus arsenicus]|uniref:Sugar kinase n=1 Tax=Fictibacillus arsenicus TaxID=255247 RepID=A0A1V3GB49_9BACL|nr:ROK family transcriptional regulator [Fictibacillus arsenicus]OOE14075.1 sugar kinase [Fictibacillus arsenicus]
MDKLRIGNRNLIKDINRALVIENIRVNGPISRTDVSKKVKLSLSTVTNIVEDLITHNLVYEVGTATSTGGRRPILLELNDNFGYTFGIKIEERQVIIALTNLKATILLKKHYSFIKGSSPEVVLNMIQQGIEEILFQFEITNEYILGIGLASSGLISRKNGKVLRSTLLNWEDINLCAQLRERFNVPIFIDNDVNAYTLAEYCLGIGRLHKNFICLSVGAGIGTGIVINNQLYYGEHGGAGEFGHIIVNIDGYKCHCGQNGCLEMYASEPFLAIEGNYLKAQYATTLLDEDFSFSKVYEAATKRDDLAIELLKRLGKNIGVGMVSAINSFNPSMVVLVGEGMIAKDFFLPYALKLADQNFFSNANCKTQIKLSKLGDDAWVQGAALLAINQLFQVPLYEESELLIK